MTGLGRLGDAFIQQHHPPCTHTHSRFSQPPQLGAHHTHTHDTLYASGLSFEGEVSTAEEQLLLTRETERMRGKALEHTQDHVAVNQLISRRITTERLAHAHLQQHTTETARDAHAPAQEGDKVLG